MGRFFCKVRTRLLSFVACSCAGFCAYGIDYNIDLREELETAKRADAFVSFFDLDASQASKRAADSINSQYRVNCLLANVNLEVINVESPAIYLRFPVERERYIYARLTKSAETAGGSSWEGQVLSQDGGRVAVFYNEEDHSVTGFIDAISEFPWSFRKYGEKNMICQDSGGSLNDVHIRFPVPDAKSK